MGSSDSPPVFGPNPGKKKYFNKPLDCGEALAWHSSIQGSALRYSKLRMMGFLDAMNKPVW
jgi:hypothetical protein